jgi:hypothetical protein
MLAILQFAGFARHSHTFANGASHPHPRAWPRLRRSSRAVVTPPYQHQSESTGLVMAPAAVLISKSGHHSFGTR